MATNSLDDDFSEDDPSDIELRMMRSRDLRELRERRELRRRYPGNEMTWEEHRERQQARFREQRGNRFTMVTLPERAAAEFYIGFVQYDKLGAIVNDDDIVVADGGRWLYTPLGK